MGVLARALQGRGHRKRYLFVLVRPGLVVGVLELLGLEAVLAGGPGSSVGVGQLGRRASRRGGPGALRGMLGAGLLGCHVVGVAGGWRRGLGGSGCRVIRRLLARGARRGGEVLVWIHAGVS